MFNESGVQNIELAFSTPIYYNILEERDTLHKEFIKNKDKINFGSAPEFWGKTNKISTPRIDPENIFNQDVISDYNLVNMGLAIDKYVRDYCEKTGVSFGSYNRESWLTKSEKGDYSQIHNHLIADISGCYYYQTNGSDGHIFFESPAPSMKTSLAFYHLSYRWRHEPRVGKMVMFPGWLEHGVTTNTTDSERISLAFNIIFKRKQHL